MQVQGALIFLFNRFFFESFSVLFKRRLSIVGSMVHNCERFSDQLPVGHPG